MLMVSLTTDPDTGLPIPYGAGLKAQIPNKGTYSILTFKKINKIISDIFYGALINKCKCCFVYRY
jgi:hypothetical protein